MSEEQIAFHFGPALAGIKPANLISCRKRDGEQIAAQVQRLNRAMNQKDIYFKILSENDVRVLVLVYRKKQLEKQLGNRAVLSLLKKFGYKESDNLEQMLKKLSERLKDDEFPHEIGAFLGYPTHDILGFIQNRGAGAVLTGDWKVYADPEGAKATFRRYKTCRHAIQKRLKRGETLAQVFCCRAV